MAPAADTETPLLKQYRAVKAEYPDAILMFRIGDFFEMFEKDAEIAARELELTLTGKAMGKAGRLPLAGVPHHSVESYIARLVRRGYHVAVCDQTEDPAKAKGLVRREVTRLVTPGTLSASDSRANLFLAAYVEAEKNWGIAFCDLLTGELYTATGADTAARQSFLARFRPREILVAEDLAEERRAGFALVENVFFSPWPAWRFAADRAGETLKRHFAVATLTALGLGDDRGRVNLEGVAAAVVLEYLAETQKAKPAHVTAVRRLATDEAVQLDPATLLSLEITESPSGDRQATLLALLDRAVTAMGSRLIARRLQAPVRNAAELRRRLELVATLFDEPVARGQVRETLKRVNDLERLAARLSLNSITPRETAGLARSLAAVGELRGFLEHAALAVLKRALDDLPEAAALIRARIVEDPPIDIGSGPLFREGVSEKLDKLRRDSRASRDWIAALQEKERARTGINSLKVSFNNVFNYFIEVTRANLEKVPPDYIRKQTTSQGERYYTEDLKKHEEVVLRADERIAATETELFAALRADLLPFLPRLQTTAAAVAELDLSAAFAEIAEERRFARPEIVESDTPLLRIEKGRHPVVEALLESGGAFVPNDTDLKPERRFVVLTGPNMSGKSTYIRQAAIIALMAQAGSFVPAASCALTPCDAFFTRIGAADRLARGLSTFMVEMVEAASILRGSTPRSLVILDEIGRGTSTYDGLAIAWAMVEALSARGCLTLFATHYHELTKLEESVPGVVNATVAVREWGEKIHFLHEIIPGAADRSYGIQVAALAGVTAPVIARAKEILRGLEMGEIAGRRPEAGEQLTFWSEGPAPADPAAAEVIEALRKLDVDGLSPRAALDELARLKGKVEGR